MRARLLALVVSLLAGAPALADDAAGRVVLRWQSVPGAGGYDLQIAGDAAFARRELEVRVEVAGYRLKLPPSAQRRYWRVRTVDADGRPGPWSAAKTIEPLGTVAPPEPPAEPPGPPPLDVPFTPDALPALGPLPMARPEPAAERAPRLDDEPLPFELPAERALLGNSMAERLRQGAPGVLVGLRANLLGVEAPELALEGTWPVPWLGARWRAGLRAGWWRERATVPATPTLAEDVGATADVVPVSVLLVASLPTPWARGYAGGRIGVDLVVVRVQEQGALEASATLGLLAGAGRGVGPGEAFVELAGGLGGVDGPLGRLRTGGLSFSVGYRLQRQHGHATR